MKNTTILFLDILLVLICFVSLIGIQQIVAIEEVQAGGLWAQQEGLGKAETGGSADNIGATFGGGTNSVKDPRILIIRVVKMFLTFLGIIMTCLVMWGGYTWMTAMGNSDKVDKAKQTIGRAVVGIVIILSSYFITVVVAECAMDLMDGTTNFICQ